jgi:hypothetical protein
MLNTLQARSHTYIRKLSPAEGTISTSAGGTVAVGTICASTLVSSTPDFASCAGIYQLYRVRAMVIECFPNYLVNTTAVTLPPFLVVSPHFNGNSVISLQGHLDASGSKKVVANKPWTMTTAWAGDPEAHFWTPVSAAVPAAEGYGITVIGSAQTSTVSLAIMRTVVNYIVEFKMAS